MCPPLRHCKYFHRFFSFLWLLYSVEWGESHSDGWILEYCCVDLCRLGEYSHRLQQTAKARPPQHSLGLWIQILSNMNINVKPYLS